MPVCLYIFLLVFQFACENFFPTAFLFHFFLSNFAPFVPSSPLCRCLSTPLLPPPDPPISLPLLMFFPLFLRPPSVPLVYPFLPPLLLFPTSSTIPLLLFSLLAPRSSFPFAILSFFLSLPFYYFLLFLLVPAPCFVFVSSVLSPSLRHSVSVHLRLPLCSCALFPCVLPSNILCSLSTSPSSCLFSMFSRLFLFTLFRFSCAGVYPILSCTLSYHRRLPYASFIFVNFIVLSLELLSLLSVQRLARLSASRLFFYLFKLSSSSMTHYFILLHSSLPLVVLH